MKKQELKVEYVPKDTLKTYANNAKVHTPTQIEGIKNSIKKFGFNDPIAVWKDNEIIEGHGRLMAALEMDEIEQIPIIRLDSLSDKERKAYIIAHNKLTLSTNFDNEILGEELKTILGDFDMTDFGFGDFELSILTQDFEPEPFDKEEISAYEGNEDKFTANKRIIVTYHEEEEDLIRKLLGVEADEPLKVAYRVTEIITE